MKSGAYGKGPASIGVWVLTFVILIGLGGYGQQAQSPEGDYGDAPDALYALYQHTDPEKIAQFPSSFNELGNASYILHRSPLEEVFLGKTVTLERDAFLINQDKDDGWLPQSFPSCTRQALSLEVTVPETASGGPIYLNVAFDWNQDGAWSGSSSCEGFSNPASEWAVKNLRLDIEPYRLKPGTSKVITLPDVLIGPNAGEAWSRFTVSTEQVGAGWNGAGDFAFGETEDHLMCVQHGNQALDGCPVMQTEPFAANLVRSTPMDQAVDILLPVFDLEGDALTCSIEFNDRPASGTAEMTDACQVTYTPETGFSGTDQFSYRVEDPMSNLFKVAQVTVEVDNENPVAQTIVITTPEDEVAVIQLLGDDPDDDELTYSLDTEPFHGALGGSLGLNEINAFTGEAIYTPDLNFNGLDFFLYRIDDGNGGFDSALVLIQVTPVNDFPEAEDDEAVNPDVTTIAFNVTANDFDVDGDTLVVSAFTQPPNGTVTCAGAICFYTPDDGFDSGFDAFTYTTDDRNGGTDEALVRVRVGNLPPTTVNDTATTPEDVNVTINVLANDSDIDGDPFSVTGHSQPGSGTVSCNATQCTYNPNNNFFGTDSFSYTATDSLGGSSQATVTVTVTPRNDAPVANNDSGSTNEDTAITINVLLNDTDVEGNSLTITGNTQGGNGSVSCGSPATSCRYTPDSDFHGADSFTYTISDGNGGTDTATVNVNVASINDAPEADDDTVTTDEDNAVAINVLDNDSDVDGDTLNVTATTDPSDGSIQVNNNVITYTPDQHFNGSDSFTYTISDGNGGSDTATVNITVNPINDFPVADDDTVSTNEDTAITITVLANDADIDGDALFVSATTNPSNGAIQVNGNNTITYTPDSDYHGSDSFTYTISDGNGGTDTATVNITVNSINDNPVAVDDNVSVNEDDQATFNVVDNDSDVDGDTLNVTATTNPSNGAIQVNGNNITYTPDVNFDGTDSFTYTISDGNGGSDTGTVNITINPFNDPPKANDDSASVNEDNPVTIAVLSNDSDQDGDSISVSATTDPANGSVQINGGSTITYTPNQHFHGSDSFTYTLSDGNGGFDTATVNVTVNPINDNPDASDDSASTNEDDAVTISVLGNDSDLDGDSISVSNASDPANGSVQINGGTTITYMPDQHFNGSDSFTYTISDGNGGSDTATVTVTVNPINDAPDAQNDSASTSEDNAVTISVLSNDSDIDGDTLTVTATTNPGSGSVSINGGTTITYTPDSDFNGADSFTYTISDGNGGSDTATVNVTVTPINDAPVAGDDSGTVDEDNSVIISVLGNDSDIDGDTLTVTAASDPANGSVQINSGTTITYTPDQHFNGSDSFVYTISDGKGGTDTATVSVTVNPINDLPVANLDTTGTNEDNAVVISVLSNDTDIDGDTLTVISTTDPSNGSVQINGGTTITYTPDSDFNGVDSFMYTIDDGNGGQASTNVTVNVTAVNDAPVAGDDSASVDEDDSVVIPVLDNDSDVDLDALSISNVGPASNGAVQITGGTAITYTPNTNFNGSDSFTYTVSDGNGGTDTATVNVTVNPVNDNPTANNDSANTDEDTAVTVNVLTNDGDLDGDSINIVFNTDPANGLVTCTATSCTYTPNANFNGSDSFMYTIGDGNGGSDTATVTVVVGATNDAPVAVNDSATTDEDNAVTISVLSNDSDIDGDSLSISGTTNPSNGAIVVNGGTMITYTPNAHYFGADSFTYTVSDGNGGSDSATVNITVNSVNDVPVAGDDSATTDEDNPVTVSVLSNDSDIDADTLTVTSTSDPANGSVQINGGTTITYTPDSDFNGSDSFTYTIEDGNGGSTSATVNITVNPINDAPVAGNDTVSVDEDNSLIISVLSNDSDVDGDTMTVIGTTSPSNGSVQINGGTTITYTPDQHFNGSDSFTYTIDDGNGGQDTATVNVTVNSINDNPVAGDDSAITDEDNTVVVNILDNDTDVDLDSLTVVSTTSPSNGSVQINGGTTITYTPDQHFNGSDSFTYTIEDGNGGSDSATVNITVNAINDAPDAQDDSASVDEDNPVTITVLGNDNDVDGDTMTVTNASDPANGTVQINGGSTITYTPDSDFNGSDSFTYTISDGNGGSDTATVNITVNAVNDDPVAMDDDVITNEDTPLTFDALFNDSDVDLDTLSITGTSDPSNGSVQINGDNTLTYTPDQHYFGADSFTYTISDGAGGTDTATVNITVNPINDVPVANTDNATTDEDNAVTINVLSNDTDADGDSLDVITLTQPSNGNAQLNGDDTITYTPDSDFNGNDSFSYTIDDGNGGITVGTVNMTVNPVNDAPVASDDSASTNEDNAVVVNVLDNDSDVDLNTLTVISTTSPSNGAVQINGGTTITYTPNQHYFGPDSFTYTIDDGDGGQDTATVNITVNSVNDVPVTNTDNATTDEDNAVVISVLGNDTDADGDSLTVTNASDPANGSVSINGGATITYTPDADFNGSDSFTYTISDGNGGTNTGTVNVTVNPVNDAPVAVDDTAGTNEDNAVVVSVLVNDSDVDGDTMTVVSTTGPSNGTVQINGGTTITYTPNQHYFGPDSFTYTIEDGNGGSDTATVNVTVSSVNDAPDAVADSATTNEDNAVVISVLSNDSDVEGDTLSVDSATDPANGSVQINGDNTITYTPDQHFNGADSFTYTVSDGNGGSNTALVTVTVNAVNDNPVANTDVANTNEDNAVVINVLDNDTDVDLDSLTVVSTTSPSNGSVQINGGTTITYTPNQHYFGNDSFTYTISDGNGGSAVGTVNVNVISVNDAPVANDDSASTNEDEAVLINVLSNDSDVEGDILTISSNTDPANGSVVCGATNCTYTPNAHYFGSDSFSYTIDDGNSGVDTATVNITISSINDAPDVQDDSATTDEDNAVIISVLSNDSDVEGDTLTVDSATSPSNGTVQINGDNTITYTPDADFFGSDSFVYTVIDGNGGSNTATVNLTVNSINDNPVAVNDNAATDEDNAVNIDVLDNDSDVDLDTLTVDATTSPSNGSVFVEADNTITYTPNLNFSGADSFTYTVIDGQGGSATATVNVTIGALNDAPVAGDDSASTDEDNAVVISVLSNDSDVEGDTLTVTATTDPANGTVQINGGTTITYTPNADFFGSDSFVYTVDDGNGGADTATVNITVNPINDAPVANTDDVSTNEDNALLISVLTNDSDVDGDTITITANTQGSNGSVSCTATDCTYTPNQHYFGPDSFTYTIEDGNGGSDTGTVNVTVNSVNDVPVAVDDSATTDEDTSVNIDVLGDDTDVDGDSLSVSNTTTPGNGNVVIEADNTITYTPNAHFFGNDSFVYTVSDGNGGADTATVSITVNPVNDDPDAADDSASVDEDSSVIVTVLTNDSDVDGDTVDVTSVSAASNGTTQLNGDDTITYTPNTHFNGNDSFTYTVSDGNGGSDTATVNVTVNSVNDAPVASDDSATTDEDTPVVITVLTNDSDVDLDSLSVSSAGPASNGSVQINGDNTVTYTPSLNFNGADSFSYTVIDGNGGSDTATVNITVNAVNDAPDAVADNASVDEDNSVNINVLANDSDVEGDPLDVTTTTSPSNGSVVVEANDTITYTPDAHFNGVDSFDYTVIDGNGGVSVATVTVTVNSINDIPVANDDSDSTNEDTQVAIDVAANDTDADGDTLSVDSHSQGSNGSVSCVGGICTYTPNQDFNGVDSFTYTIGDGNGGSDNATVNLTINAVNDDPVAVDDSATTDEDMAVVINVLSNDSDVELDTLTVTSTSTPSKGTTQINGDNTITYTPNISLNGPDSFTYTVEDGNGGSATATVNITINSINDNPIANDDSGTVDEDNPITIDVIANDIDDDIGDVLTATVNTQPSNGSANCSVNDCTYTPDPNFHGVDSFIYTVDDGQGGSDTATVTVTVNSVNDIPVAGDDNASVDEDNSINFVILGNDSDDDGDTLTIVSNTQPANGSVVVEVDDTVTYTPDAHFNGIDTFTYTIEDGNGGSDTATVTVTVNSINDLPVANDDDVTTDEDTVTNINVAANDTDDDGDTLTVDSHTQPGSGSVTCSGGSCTYTPDQDFFGADSFTYTITDGNGAFDTATVNLTVTPVNDDPVANADSTTMNEDSFTTMSLTLNDSDVEGDTISITDNTQGSNGAVSCTATDCTYTPNADFFGADSFTYTISDGNGGTAVGNVDITVTNINDVPVANADSATIDEDNNIAIDVIANDVDADGDTLTITNLTFPSDGSVSCNGNTCTYTPDANFNGVDSFTYTINDGNGETDTATVTITVNSIQDAPVANDDTSPFILEDFQANIDVLNNDFDPDGDAFSIVSHTQPSNGTVTCSNSCTYTPDPNFNGNDSFTYTIEDSTGLQDTATVNVTVLPSNDRPTAVDDDVTTDEDVAAVIDVLANDFDVDGDTLTLESNTNASNGSVVCSTTCTYTPNANFNGVDSFTYTINDGNGRTDTATVNLTVNAVNDVPVANTDADSLDEDTFVVVDVLANDTDADGDSLTIVSNTQGGNGSVVCSAIDCTYTPSADFNGADSFTYTVDDGNSGQSIGTVNITVNPINDAPVANDDAHTLDEDTVANIVVTANDTDVDGDTLSATLLTNATRGDVVCSGDTCTYTPDPHFNGTDSFTYTVDDGNGGSDTATVDLTINSVPDPTTDPDAVNDNAVTDEDMFIDIDVLANDSDADGDPLNVAANTQPTNGTASCLGAICTYTPDPDFFGVDSFMYTVEDGQGGFADATVTVTVNSVNDFPVANDDMATLDEDDFLSIDVLANDTDLEGDILSVLSSTQGSNGSVVCSATECTYTPDADFNGTDSFTYTVDDGNGGTDTANVDVTVNAVNDDPVAVDDSATTDEEMAVVVDVLANDSDVDLDSISITTTFNLTPNGSVSCTATQCTYTPDENFFGTDNFSYDMEDGNGGTATANVTVTVNPINDAPVANDDVAPFVLEDSQVNVNVLSNDGDPDGDPLTVTIDTFPSNGTVVVKVNNTIDYIPDPDYNGTDSFVYMIDDGNGLTDTATVDVTVLAKNDKPVAVDDNATTDEDVAVVIDVLVNDSDVDGDTLTITGNTQGTNGSVSCTATDCTYTPNTGFFGSDSFTYTVDDGNGGSDTATVNVTVNEVVASIMDVASAWPLMLGFLLNPVVALWQRVQHWRRKKNRKARWIPIPRPSIKTSGTEFFR